MFDPEKERLKDLRMRIGALKKHLDVDHMTARLSELSEVLADGALWNDAERAQTLLKEQKDLETKMERLKVPTKLVEA